jgi:hypothetical protein
MPASSQASPRGELVLRRRVGDEMGEEVWGEKKVEEVWVGKRK